MSGFRGRVAVVTGAAAGIGRALALGLARRGARLALCDVDAEPLARTAADAAALGAPVHAAAVDVADRDGLTRYAAAVAARFGVVHQLYNNAGIAGPSATVAETDPAVFERVLAVNLMGVVHGTRAFLPHLAASGEGHVVNLSSLNGFLAQPSLAPYCAAKFGVRGFTEALRAELLAAGQPVRVTVVHPGGVRTGIAAAALRQARAAGADVPAAQEARVRVYEEKLLRMPPGRAATLILDGVARNRPRVLVGRDARAADLLVRLLPGRYPRLVAWWDRRTFGRR